MDIDFEMIDNTYRDLKNERMRYAGLQAKLFSAKAELSQMTDALIANDQVEGKNEAARKAFINTTLASEVAVVNDAEMNLLRARQNMDQTELELAHIHDTMRLMEITNGQMQLAISSLKGIGSSLDTLQSLSGVNPNHG